MKDGFYSLFQAGGDQDPADDEAYGLALLIHIKDGRFVGVDQGGCRASGEYLTDANGRIAMHLIYEFKAGSQMADGSVLDDDRRLEADLLLAPGAADGDPQRVDIGLAPMFIRFKWLAEAV